MEEQEILSKERTEKVKNASIIIWTLLTICLIYAVFKGYVNSLGIIILLMMYYIGIMNGFKTR